MTTPVQVQLLQALGDGNAGPVGVEQLATACAVVLEVEDVAVQLRTQDRATSGLGSSTLMARRAEEEQIALDEGPSIDARRTGVMVVAPDLESDGARWPVASGALVAVGVLSVQAHPLHVRGIALGSLTGYGTTVDGLHHVDARNSTELAAAVTRVVIGLPEDPSDDEPINRDDRSGSTVVLERRAVIHQATGMIAAQIGGSVAEAYVRLQARAFADGVGVLELATDVVGRRVRFTS